MLQILKVFGKVEDHLNWNTFVKILVVALYIVLQLTAIQHDSMSSLLERGHSARLMPMVAMISNGTVAEIARENLEQIIGEKLSGEPIETEPESQEDTRNPAAVALSKLGASKGGKARAAKLSKKRRSQIAKKVAQARWAENRND